MNIMALARIYEGQLIADCPRPHCGNAEPLTAWQPWFVCTSRFCGIEVPVQWPPDLPELWDALKVRGNPKWMNWFPDGHPVALAHGCPHGQSVADLNTETLEHAAELEQWAGFALAAATTRKAVT